MADDKLNRQTYLSKNVGSFPDTASFLGHDYTKVDDLRYGTNPHQTAAFYKPANRNAVIGDMVILKNGKSGLSQTNLEDISYSLNIVKFFDRPACACMKHVNPCGAAIAAPGDSLKDVYIKARDCDDRAVFGAVIAFNTKVDADTASEIMKTFVECVVAPDFDDEAVAIFSNPDSKTLGHVVSTVKATPEQLDDLLAAWYINISVRSNGVIIVKNGGTLCVGTGEQDRVGAVEQAIVKFKDKYHGKESIKGSVMASDGFFPFPDGVEVAAAAGVTAIIAPAGSLKDADVIIRANELGVALFHAPERVFSHH